MKGLTPVLSQRLRNTYVGKPVKKYALNRGYALIKQMSLTTGRYGMHYCIWGTPAEF